LPGAVAAAPVLVTTVAVAAGTVVVATLTLRLRPLEAAPAAQAPVHTAMTTMVTQIPMQQSGTRTAMTIPPITAPEIAFPRSVKSACKTNDER
jgi:hypothetical protein